MGERGPAPKRSDQRRRTNKPAVPVAKAPDLSTSAPTRSSPRWHPVAKRWFDSLAKSGQSQFYTASDWATAYVLAESISRELRPQPIVVGHGADAAVEFHELPPKGASLAAWLKGMTALLATEGDRRRASLELQRPKSSEGDGDVAWIDDARRRLHGTG